MGFLALRLTLWQGSYTGSAGGYIVVVDILVVTWPPALSPWRLDLLSEVLVAVHVEAEVALAESYKGGGGLRS